MFCSAKISETRTEFLRMVDVHVDEVVTQNAETSCYVCRPLLSYPFQKASLSISKFQ